MIVQYDKKLDVVVVGEKLYKGNILIHFKNNSPVKKCTESRYIPKIGYTISRNILNEKQVKYFKRIKV